MGVCRRDDLPLRRRERLHLTVQRVRSQMKETVDPVSRESLTAADQAAIHRRVVPRTLVEIGIVSTTWRSVILPIKPRKLARILVGDTNVREILSTRVRVVSSLVFATMAFGFGVLVSSAKGWGDWGIGIGAIILLFGSIYGFVLGTCVLWCLSRRKGPGRH